MDGKNYWKKRWVDKEISKETNFSKRTYAQIKNRKNKKVLEIGCGDGGDTIYFGKKGLDITAVDLSESGLKLLQKVAKEKNLPNIKTIRSDIRKLKISNNSYDIIYAHLSLHYFDDKTTTKIFNNLFKILKKGGLLFVKCKSTDDALYGKGEKIEENFYLTKKYLRRFFSKEYMSEKLEKFKILKIRKTASVHRHYKSSFIEAVATKIK